MLGCFRLLVQAAKKHRYSTLTIIGLLVWFGWYAFHGPNLSYDSADFAQMARQMYEGEGMTSLQVYPSQLEYFAEHKIKGPPYPNLYRFPYPIINILLHFYVFGVNDFAVVFFSGLFFALGLPLVYWVSLRFFSSRVALLGSFLYAVCLPLLHYSIRGLSESCAAFFTTAIGAMIVVGCAEKRRYWYFLLAGFVLGISILNRTNFILFVPVALFFMLIWLGRNARMLRAAISLMIGVMVVISPWMVRNTVVAGSPFFSFTVERNLVENDLISWLRFNRNDPFLSLHNQPFKELVYSEPGRVAEKYLKNVAIAFLGYHQQIELFIPFFFIGLFVARSVLPRRLITLMFAFGFVQYMVLCLGIPLFKYFVPYIPVFLIFAARGMEWLFFEVDWGRKLGVIKRPKLAAKTAFVLLFLLYFGLYRDFFTKIPNDNRKEFREHLAFVEKLTRRDKIIVSDFAPFFAWYNHTPSLQLPTTPEHLHEIDEKYLHLDYILFIGPKLKSARWRKGAQYYAWTKAGYSFDGFKTAQTFSSGAILLERENEVNISGRRQPEENQPGKGKDEGE